MLGSVSDPTARALPANTFWFGKRLPTIEQVCLHSMVAVGQPITLWAYEKPESIPDGVVFRDAAEILSRSTFIAYSGGRGARLFADIFRIELLRKNMGLWLDADCLMLKPILSGTPYMFGWEDDRRINNAVLHMPADSELTARLWEFVNTRPVVPPWWPLPKQWWQRAVHPLGLARKPESIAFGSFGPKIVTHLVISLGLQEYAQPRSRFYPILYNETRLYFQPGGAESRIGTDTYCCHLWLSNIQDRVNALGADAFYSNTFLGQQFKRFGVDATA